MEFIEFIDEHSELINVIIVSILFVWGIIYGGINFFVKLRNDKLWEAEEKKRYSDIIKANEKNSEQQIRVNIKPELILNVPAFEEASNSEEEYKLQKFGRSDHFYFLKNYSQNIAYNVEFLTFIYLSNQGWEKYYELIKKRIDDNYDKKKNEQNKFNYFDIIEKKYTNISPGKIASSSFDFHDIKNLHENDSIDNNIPSNFFNLNVLDNELNPKLYVFINYQDKVGFSYEDCYQLICVNHSSITSGGYFNKRKVDKDKVRDKIIEQKRYLKEDFPNPTDVFYYSFKKR